MKDDGAENAESKTMINMKNFMNFFDQFYLFKNILNNESFNAEFTKKCYLEELLHDSVSTPLLIIQILLSF